MNKPVMSVEEYRHMLNDHISKDGLIEKRIQFMESLCRNVIRIELSKTREEYREVTKINGGLKK